MNIFEQASKEKLRFTMTKGSISTEDLWDLKLEDLDIIAQTLNKQIRDSRENESFIRSTSTKSKALVAWELAFEIVKRVIEVKLEEKERKALAAEKAAKRAQLIELIGKKELTALESQSVDDLKKQLAELD